MLIDLHTHTYPKSDDSFVSVDDLIDRAKSLGLAGVCLTEPAAFWSAEEVTTLSRRHDFLVLSGSEINTDAGHILVFGLCQYVFGLHKPPFLRQMVNQSRGVMIAAIPTAAATCRTRERTRRPGPKCSTGPLRTIFF